MVAGDQHWSKTNTGVVRNAKGARAVEKSNPWKSLARDVSWTHQTHQGVFFINVPMVSLQPPAFGSTLELEGLDLETQPRGEALTLASRSLGLL